jgi:succinoglycan biosynthesis protein ExoV
LVSNAGVDVVEIIHSKANFGDDLNLLLWKEILPPEMFDAEDIVMVGIGSILNEEMLPASKTRGKRVYILGSGASYGALPTGWEAWSLLAFRGPLTAQLFNRPEAAITDGAALMAAVPALMRQQESRDLILFMPHHSSIERGRWDTVARACGYTFVDPQWHVSKILTYFSRAKLVIAEAMHAAIVADTMRIPWIPIWMSPDISAFKWRDWTSSLELPFQPVAIQASSLREKVRHREIVREAEREGQVPASRVNMEDASALLTDHQNRYRIGTLEGERTGPKTNMIRRVVKQASKAIDPWFVEMAASQLRRLPVERSYLSKDAIFKSRVSQLLDAVGVMSKEVLG